VLWQADLSHGPYISINGKMKKTFLIAYIDDCSRLVPYAQFFTSERFDGLREVTREALIRRGKPTIIYADNGKIYRSETLQHACAQLGITLAHTSPYDPKAKGKIERVFKTIQTRFYPRSEERRVGKEGRSGGARERRERKRTRDQRAVSGERRRG